MSANASASDGIPPLTVRCKRGVKKIIRCCAKDFALGYYFPRVYRKAANEPVDPCKVVFLEGKAAAMPDSFKVLYGKLEREYDFDLQFISLGQTRVRLRQYYRNCVEAVKQIATAKYVFLNDASDVVSCLPLRGDTKVAQLWHACGAFKKWGMSTADLLFGGSRKDLQRHPFYRNLSLVTVSSPEVVWAYAQAMDLRDCEQIIKPLGVSRTDLFFDDDYRAQARLKLEAVVPQCDGKKVLLYAPTFRGRVASAEGPDKLDVAAFKASFEGEYVLLIKHHPFVKVPPKIPQDCEDFAFQIGTALPIDVLLCVADICISDYSSLVFEYSLLQRPMIFFAYDIDDYNDWRGFFYDYDQLTPGPVLKDNRSMIDYIKHVSQRFDKQEVIDFKEKFMSACDGHATQRICEDVFGDDLDKHCLPTVAEQLRVQNPDGKDISIVIPAYNAMPYIKKAIESLLSQTYDRSRMQIVVVDDASTDDTGAYVKECARRYPDLITALKMDQNAGNPGLPRNKGMECATGTYLFFLDADDWLAPEAVQKMLDHAVQWNSDVLLVKMWSDDGREVPQSMFDSNQAAVDIYASKIFWSLAPTKLFRRSLIQRNHIRFFEKGMPEDLQFVIPAICASKIVSVASDYDYCQRSWIGEGANASSTIWSDLESNLRSYRVLLKYIAQNTPDGERDLALMRRLFRRDFLLMFITVAQSSKNDQQKYYEGIKQLVLPFYTQAVYETCPFEKRMILDAACFGDVDVLTVVTNELKDNPSGFVNECSFSKSDGRILCTIPQRIGALTCDITKSVEMSAAIDRISFFESGFKMNGTLDAPVSFQKLSERTKVYIIAKAAGNRELICPCNAIWNVVHSTGANNKVQAIWESEVAVEKFLPDTFRANGFRALKHNLRTNWHLYIRVACGDYVKEIRLGDNASAYAKEGFQSFMVTVGDNSYSGYVTEYGNFSIHQAKNR